MNKLGYMIFFLMSLSASAQHADLYYFQNPKVLQAEMEKCMKHTDDRLDCQHIDRLANEYSQLVYELRQSPQEFGQSIMALQIAIAKISQTMNKKPGDKDLTQELKRKEISLSNRLALVKTFESPTG